MGVGMGMNAGGNFMAAASQTNAAQMERQAAQKATSANGWNCVCGAVNNGKFCSECGKAKPEDKTSWKCECGSVNMGRFCPECGKSKPENTSWFCPECGAKNTAKFCSECGTKRP